MSLEECQHLGRKLDDRHTCVLLCDRFPVCVRPSPLREALDLVAALDPVREDGAGP